MVHWRGRGWTNQAGRFMYSASIAAQTVDDEIDLFTITSLSGSQFTLHSVRFGQTTLKGDAGEFLIPVRICRSNAVPAAGILPVVRPHSRNLPAAENVCVAVNDPPVSEGSLVPLVQDTFNTQLPYLYRPVYDEQLDFGENAVCVIRLGAPPEAIVMHGTITWEEVK